MNSIKLTPKTEKQHPPLQKSPNQSLSHLKQSRFQCQNCLENSNIICYACCYSLACEKCFTHQHFINCSRQFNKHTLNLNSGVLQQQNKSKKNGKSKYQGKCKRCQQNNDLLEWCKQCNYSYCKDCSCIIHSKGKFINHCRTVSQSPEKIKRYETIKTQNVEQDISMRWDKRQRQQNLQYGFKAKEKNNRNTPTLPNKKGRSIAKNSFQNQQNTPVQHKRKSSIAMSDVDNKSRKGNQPIFSNSMENPWLLCQRHPKLRTILTESFDLVCTDCYEELRQLTAKVKTIDVQSWLKSELDKSCAFGYIESIQQFTTIKGKELQLQFQRYRKELQDEYNTKRVALEERYRNNLMNVDKWYNTYQESLKNIERKCQAFNVAKDKVVKEDDHRSPMANNLYKVHKLQSLVLYEEIVKMKKQFAALLQQYQFRVSEINPEQFEQLLKNFAFMRKKNEDPANTAKNINKMSQSAQMRQSRVSNSSLTSDRKCLKREESMVKSSYYQLSHSNNLMKRSISKDIREDISKDISQRILFPTNSDKKQMQRQKDLKTCTVKQKNSYFFENAPQDNTKLSLRLKECEHPDIGFKDVKYINLQTIITEKLDKGVEKAAKKEHLQLSTPALIEDTKTTYTVEMTEDIPDFKIDKNHFNMLADARMIQSVTISQHSLENRGNTIVSGNNLQAVKTKRKSDYMEMRDRLRKPSIMTKIQK